MDALKAHASLLWAFVQLLGYVGLGALIALGVPLIIVLGLVAAGWAHP